MKTLLLSLLLALPLSAGRPVNPGDPYHKGWVRSLHGIKMEQELIFAPLIRFMDSGPVVHGVIKTRTASGIWGAAETTDADALRRIATGLREAQRLAAPEGLMLAGSPDYLMTLRTERDTIKIGLSEFGFVASGDTLREVALFRSASLADECASLWSSQVEVPLPRPFVTGLRAGRAFEESGIYGWEPVWGAPVDSISDDDPAFFGIRSAAFADLTAVAQRGALTRVRLQVADLERPDGYVEHATTEPAMLTAFGEALLTLRVPAEAYFLPLEAQSTARLILEDEESQAVIRLTTAGFMVGDSAPMDFRRCVSAELVGCVDRLLFLSAGCHLGAGLMRALTEQIAESAPVRGTNDWARLPLMDDGSDGTGPALPATKGSGISGDSVRARLLSYDTISDMCTILGRTAMYLREFGALPLVSASEEQDIGVLNTLMPEITWVFRTDPWGRRYHVALDTDGDGLIRLGDREFPGRIVIWSAGTNELDDKAAGDDVWISGSLW